MVDPSFFIQDLAVILVSATIGGYFAKRLGLSPVVGYISAGLVVGTPAISFPYVYDSERIALIAQLGVVFLMFSIGLRFRLERLRELGWPVVMATVLTAILIFISVRGAVGWMGLSVPAAVTVAAVFMNSSSAIISKLLEERGIGHERYGQLALGITLLEDIVAVVMLAILGSYLMMGDGEASISILSTIGLLAGFALLVFVVGLLLLPKVLSHLSRGKGGEAVSICVAGLLFGIALLSVQVGYSIALGAFLFGVVIAETKFRPRVERTFQGLKDIFLTLFFVTIGIFVDVSLLPSVVGWIVLGTIAALGLRTLVVFISLLLAGEHPRNALQTGFCVTPLGEFSFIIAAVAIGGGLFGERFQALVVGVVLGTSLLSPLIIANGSKLSAFLAVGRWPALERWHEFCRANRRESHSDSTKPHLWMLLRRRIVQIFVELIIVVTVVIFAWKWYEKAAQSFPRLFESVWAGGVFWLALGVFCLLPLVAVWRNFFAVTMIVEDYSKHVYQMHPRRSRWLGWLLRVIFATLLALMLWLLLPAELPRGWSGLLIVLILGLVLGFLWRDFIRIHSDIESDFEDQLSESKRSSARVLFDDWKSGNWDFNIRECIIPDNSIAAGKTLEAIALRKRTGCSVVGIERQGFRLARVGPRTQIFPSDEILLLGSNESIANAEALLQRSAGSSGGVHIEDLVLKSLLIPEGSPWAGKALVDCHWSRDFDVQVVAIRRAEVALTGPNAQSRLQTGDQVLLLGTDRALEQLAVQV